MQVFFLKNNCCVCDLTGLISGAFKRARAQWQTMESGERTLRRFAFCPMGRKATADKFMRKNEHGTDIALIIAALQHFLT
jgi:hypothetical protein